MPLDRRCPSHNHQEFSCVDISRICAFAPGLEISRTSSPMRNDCAARSRRKPLRVTSRMPSRSARGPRGRSRCSANFRFRTPAPVLPSRSYTRVAIHDWVTRAAQYCLGGPAFARARLPPLAWLHRRGTRSPAVAAPDERCRSRGFVRIVNRVACGRPDRWMSVNQLTVYSEFRFQLGGL